MIQTWHRQEEDAGRLFNRARLAADRAARAENRGDLLTAKLCLDEADEFAERAEWLRNMRRGCNGR